MRWHKEDRKKDRKLSAPADGSQWRKIEGRYWGEFVKDPRNVWFALSVDGINPFGEESSNHNTWPMTLCMYNLPPWMCMKRKFITMSVLIQGPKNFYNCGMETVYVCGMSTNRRNLTCTCCCL